MTSEIQTLRRLSKNELISLLLAEKQARQELENLVFAERKARQELEIRLVNLERLLKAFDNAHTPPSKQRKKNTKRDESKPRFPGKPPGSHGGGITIPPPDEIVEHRMENDPLNGAPLGAPVSYRRQLVFDFADKPIIVFEHRIMQYLSPVTGRLIEPSVDLPTGVYGKNLRSIVAMLKQLTNSHAKISTFIRELGAPSFSTAAVQDITNEFAVALAPERERILVELRAEPYLHADETGFRCDGHNGYIWGVFSKTRAILLASNSRARENITQLIGRYLGVLVSDGYNAYDEFKHRHRCWAHLDREFEEYAAKSDEIKIQYDRFEALYAKGRKLKAQQQADNLPINEHEIEKIKFEFWDIVTCLQVIKAARGICTLMENGGEQWNGDQRPETQYDRGIVPSGTATDPKFERHL